MNLEFYEIKTKALKTTLINEHASEIKTVVLKFNDILICQLVLLYIFRDIIINIAQKLLFL